MSEIDLTVVGELTMKAMEQMERDGLLDAEVVSAGILVEVRHRRDGEEDFDRTLYQDFTDPGTVVPLGLVESSAVTIRADLAAGLEE